MSTLLLPGAGVRITVAALDKLAVWSESDYVVTSFVGWPNIPDTENTLFNNSGAYTSAAFASATEVEIQAGGAPLWYDTGLGPVVSQQFGLSGTQGTPGTLNATGTLTAALILSGIVTSTSAAGVTATLDTGAVMDAATNMAIGQTFLWSVINTGPNTVTVTAAASGHTIVGAGAVATVTSGRFLTRKTAADTFVTYRLS